MHLHNSLLSLLAEYQYILSRQEVMWHRKSHAIWLKDGDVNTNIFHSSTFLGRRTNMIFDIHDFEGRYITDLNRVKDVLLNHFKHQWFHFDNIGSFDYPFIQAEISSYQNELLINLTFTEIGEALKSLHPYKVPGSDGFPFFFF